MKETKFMNIFLRAIPSICVLVAAQPASSQNVITTIAGNGSATYSGDGGAASLASLNHPRGVAVDRTGTVYISDPDNFRVRRVGPTGVISTLAGTGVSGEGGDGGPASAALFRDVMAVTLDAAGNIYIADAGNRRVRKVTPDGIVTTFAGIGVEAFSGDGGPATAAALGRPMALALDAGGNLYIADSTNQRIRRVSAGGIITTIAGNGINGFSGDGGAATSASLGFPVGVAVDRAGNVYVADGDNNRIRKITPGGLISTVAGNGKGGFSGDGGLATGASLNIPFSVALDSAGNLFIADAGNNRVRRVDTSGIISTVAGTGTNGFSGDGGAAAEATLDFPWGVATDGAGVYVADRANNRVRLIFPGLTGAPSLPENAALNAASFAKDLAIAPGAIVAIFGSDFAVSAVAASTTPLPKVLGQTSVSFNGTAAPLFYVSPGQINAQAPFGLAGGTVSIQVSRGGSVSAVRTISVAATSPGIFIVDPANSTGAIVHASDGSLVLAGAPARTGEFLSIYCTGLGSLRIPFQSGDPGPAAPPFAETTAFPTVLIGGVSAAITYSGLAPGFVGLYQINIQVPPVAAGNQPVQIIMSGVSSNTATMAVTR